MAYRITAICDRCKLEVTQDQERFSNYESETRFQEVTLRVGYKNEKQYLFCDKCCEELGIFKPSTNEIDKVESIGDKLIECINEIIAQQQEN